MNLRRLFSLLLMVGVSAAAFSQSSTFRLQPCVQGRVPEGITDAFVLGGELYCYASDVLFVLQRDGDRVASFRVDTDYVKLDENINYIVRHPVEGILYFTARDKKGRSCLYSVQQQLGRRPKVKNVDIDGMEVIHPVFSDDGEYMIFSSIGRKGSADYDLWYCRQTKDGWDKPHNLGNRVNTLSDETSPAVCGNRLYFVTNGQSEDNGSHGIYVINIHVTRTEGDTVGDIPLGHARVQRLPWPFCDDSVDYTAILFDRRRDLGYLLSDGDTPFSTFHMPVTAVLYWGYVRDTVGNPLAGASIQACLDGKTVASATADADGYYSLHLRSDQGYTLVTHAHGYFADSMFTHPQADNNGLLVTELHRDVVLNRLPLGRQLYYHDIFGPNTGIELTPAGIHSLSLLVRFLGDNPGCGVDLVLISDLTSDAEFNALVTEHRLDNLVAYLRSVLPSTVRLTTHNSCAGREGCNTATGTSRLTVIISEK